MEKKNKQQQTDENLAFKKCNWLYGLVVVVNCYSEDWGPLCVWRVVFLLFKAAAAEATT